MDESHSPDHFRQHLNSTFTVPHPPSDNQMATLVVPNNPPNMPSSTVNKRYRPTPAKTFQCRGYGECRMVFSRSEHLARHIRSVPFPISLIIYQKITSIIRKHTGERPFSCHCGKQFSRLDNLRQHAQTVHADKQEQNERMMRDLTSLHATMAAANKAGQPRGKRTQTSSSSTSSRSPVSNTSVANNSTVNNTINHVKEEDDSPSILPVHQRPGTTTGYEGDHHHGIIYQQAPTTWHVQTSDMDRPTSRPTNGHSFRDPGQSFLAPPPTTTTTTTSSSQTQSFLPFPSSFNFNLPDSARDGRPGSSSSRPPTSESHPRSLPPLASVVPTSIPPPSSQSFSAQQHLLHFPTLRRPSTATRPGTAPAAYYSKPPYIGGPGLVSRPELSFPSYGRDLAPPQQPSHLGGYDAELSASPTTGTSYDSPFSFHPPDSTATTTGSPPPPNPRKRPFTGAAADGADFGGPEYEYEYGSESRPQSRRLSVMELCNDQPTADREFLLLSGSRPGTSSGLVSSANALALIDRSPTIPTTTGPGSSILARTFHTAAGSAASMSGGGGEAQFGGGISPTSHHIPSAAAAATTATTILRPIRGSPTLSDATVGYSPGSASPFAAIARGLHTQPKSPSPATAAAADVLSRRGGTESHHDQVRIPVSASHTPTAVGMRV